MIRPVFGREMMCATAAIGLLLAAPTTAIAQDRYPDRPIKIVVPFPAGGAADTLARIVADRLASKWSKPVLVENRPGGSGNVGAETVAKAEPDGHTLLATPPPPLTANQYLFANLRFDPEALVPITVIAAVPNVLVARPGLTASSVPELIRIAKSEPGKLTYGSTGIGGTPHLSAEMLKSAAGIDILHVPYKNPPQILNDMLGGNVDLTFANLIDALPLIESGRLKALGIGSAERSPLLRDVPALAETAPGFLSTTWYAVMAAPNTSPHIVAKLSSAIAETLQEPDTTAKLKRLKATPVLNSPAQAAAFIADERERWRKVIAAAGLKQE